MTKQKSTKRALLMSALAMLMCVSMLIGSTFAWFTDSVTSGTNKIVAGNLDVELYHSDKAATDVLVDSTTKLFDDVTLWEPGAMVWEKLTVKNVGSLALKYSMMVTVTDISELPDGKSLADVLKVAVMTEQPTRENIAANATGTLESIALTSDKALLAGAEESFYVAIYWAPTANDNDYNVAGEALYANLGVTLMATQYTKEVDSFDENYDKNAKYLIEAGEEALISGSKLTDTLINRGTVVVDGAGIETDKVGLQNYGDATLTDVDVKAGSTADYAVILYGGSNTEFNDADITSAGGAVGMRDGAVAEFNSGKVYVDSASTSGRYCFYLEGAGTELTINGGSFSWDKNDNQKRAYVYAGAGTTVNIKGGTFGKASTRSGYTAGILGEGTVVITGGTFGFDPTTWVATGYQAIKDGANWIVLPADVNKIVDSADELQAALDAATGNYVIYVNGDITGDVTATQKADVKVTIEGNGNTMNGAIVVNGQSKRYETAGLTVKNIKFNSANSAPSAYINLGDGNNATRYTNNVTVVGCTFDYTGTGDKVAIKSYTGGDWNLTVKGCTVNSGMHSLLQVTNVEKGLTITECKVYSKNGINLNNTPYLNMSGCEFDTVGYCVRVGVNGSTNSGNFTIADSTLKSANDDGDAVVILRGTMTGATVNLQGTTLVGTPDVSGEATVSK